jgi:hypothetical protein
MLHFQTDGQRRSITFVKVSRCRQATFGPCLALLLAACIEDGVAPSGDDAALAEAVPVDASPSEASPAGTGSSCDVLSDAEPSQGVYSAEALECPSRICLKPVVQSGATGVVDTAPYCTASCTEDSDCEGQIRDATNPLDKRCQKGFTCGVAFVKGKICCQKLCLCKDFLGPQGAPMPIACQGEATLTCHEQ